MVHRARRLSWHTCFSLLVAHPMTHGCVSEKKPRESCDWTITIRDLPHTAHGDASSAQLWSAARSCWLQRGQFMAASTPTVTRAGEQTIRAHQPPKVGARV